MSATGFSGLKAERPLPAQNLRGTYAPSFGRPEQIRNPESGRAARTKSAKF